MRTLLAVITFVALVTVPLAAQAPDSVRTDSVRHYSTTARLYYTRVVTTPPRTDTLYCTGTTCTPTRPPASGTTRSRPMSLSGLLTAGVAPAPFSGSLDGYTAAVIVARLDEARAKGLQLLLNLTGGGHSQYMTGGQFDLAKWRAKMGTYDTPAIKAAVAAAVAEGMIVGSSVMDEPHNTTTAAGWGGNVTKAMVDGMCREVKAIFPTLAVGVVHDHRHFEPERNYATCDFVLSQYRLAKGPLAEFRAGALAFAARSGISLIFSLNLLHGGTPGTTCAKYEVDLSGKLCPMSAAQIREWGVALGTAACALNTWTYNRDYLDDAAIRAALQVVADTLATRPATPCRRIRP